MVGHDHDGSPANPTNGRASCAGTGVTRPTHSDDRRGDSTGTGTQPTAREAGDFGVRRHHVGVREDVGATDLEHATDRLLVLDDGDQEPQHVADRDRLALGVAPIVGVTITGSTSVR